MNLGCRESLGQELDDLLNLSSESEEDLDNQKLLSVLLSLWQQEPRRHVIDLLCQVHGSCCPKTQRLLLDLIGHDPVLAALPPRASFLLRLLKQVTAAAEDEGHELLEDLLDKYLPLVHTSPPITPWCFKTFYLTDAPSYQQLQQLVPDHAQQLLAAQQELGPLPTTSPAAAETEWFHPGCDRMTRLSGGNSSCSTISSIVEQGQQPAEGQERGSTDQEEPRGSTSSSRLAAQQPAAHTAAAGAEQSQQAGVLQEAPGSRKPPPHGWQQTAAAGAREAGLLSISPSNLAAAATADGGASRARLQQPRLISLYVSDNLFEGSTGCHEWEAGFVLGEWLAANHHLLAGQRVLELGCGSGLVGVLLAASEASHVVLTDGSLQSMTNCRDNLARNGVAAAIEEDVAAAATSSSRVVLCPWQWEGAVPPASLQVDVVVAADVQYDPKAIPPLLHLVRRLLVHAQQQQQQQQRQQQEGEEQQQQKQQQAPGGVNSSCTTTSSSRRDGVSHQNGGCQPEQQAHDAGRQEPESSTAGSARPPPAAYLAATLRSPGTYETFVGLCSSLGMRLQHVLTDAATGVGSGEQPMVDGWQCRQGPSFQAVRALSDRRKFVMQKLTLM